MKFCQLFLNALMLGLCCATKDSKRLYEDILSDYNRLIRPVENNTEVLVVQIALKLSQLIEVSLKKQVMKTNVWVEQKWKDYKLRWNPEDYGGVEMLHIPSEKIWLPDIVLYNNADGNYEVNQMTMATVYSTGDVEWNPPAIYKSACEMDVEFFPFDEQQCTMKFGSWTYDGLQVALIHKHKSKNSRIVEEGTDLSAFYLSVEWDILKVPAEHIEEYEPGSTDPYPYVTFQIVIRRKTLFYSVNLIAPCVAISFLTVLVFYLPSKSGEKVTLCISILLSLTVFFLLLAEIVPPTSLAIPLVGKYLLFTMIMVTLSVILTVVVLNVHFRSPSTHTLPYWVRWVFVDIIPRLLCMNRPKLVSEIDKEEEEASKFVIRRCNGNMRDIPIPPPPPPIDSFPPSGNGRMIAAGNGRMSRDDELYMSASDQDEVHNFYQQVSAEVQNAFEGIRFIAEHIKKADDEESIEEDWKYISMVLDRMFLCLFLFACIVGTAGIICQAPSLYDSRIPIDVLRTKVSKETFL